MHFLMPKRYRLSALQHLSPTVALASPNMYLKLIYKAVLEDIEKLPKSSQEMFRWALNVSNAYRAASDNASKELQEAYSRA